MKENIAKPKLNEDDLTVLSGILNAAYLPATKSLARRDKRAMAAIINFLAGMVQAGHWTDALRVAFQNESFGEVFRDAIVRTSEIKESDFIERGVPELYEKTQLGTMKIKKVYEYMTGKDAKTSKKLHMGVLDAD